MYLEHAHGMNKRTDWRYEYTGAELLDEAQKILDETTVLEDASRRAMAEYMITPGLSMKDDKVTKLSGEIERLAKLKEECQVFVHEFTRNYSQKYLLAMGDVVFFRFPKSHSPVTPA
jgi:hypothetical protein